MGIIIGDEKQRNWGLPLIDVFNSRTRPSAYGIR